MARSVREAKSNGRIIRRPARALFRRGSGALSSEAGLHLATQLLCAFTLCAGSLWGQPRFVDRTTEAGLDVFSTTFGSADKRCILEANGNGAAFFDYDNDGFIDLYVVNGSTFETYRTRSGPGNRLFRNNQDSTFADVTDFARVGDAGWGSGVAVGDIDDDGNPDLYVTNYGSNILYRNLPGGRFEDVTASSSVAGERYSTSAAFLDYDRDGDLDLYVANYVVFDVGTIPADPADDDRCMYLGGLRVYCGPAGMEGAGDVLYRNDGSGGFEDVTVEAGIAVANSYYGLGVVADDFDNDGDTDLFIANDETPNVLFDNEGDATFAEVAVERGVAYSGDGEAESGMGVDAADFDDDGDADLYVTNFYKETNTLYENDGAGRFTDVTNDTGLGAPTLNMLGWGTRFFDCDNDGDQDLFVANGHVYPQVDRTQITTYAQRNQLFVNDGEGHFSEIPVLSGAHRDRVSRGASFSDYDNDGDIDIFIVNLNDTPTLLRNKGGGDNNWLLIRLAGAGKDNRTGLGSRVRLRTDSKVQWRSVNGAASYLSHNDTRVHFGMGKDRRADIDVIWLSGHRQSYPNVEANRLLVVRKDGDGSVR